MPQSRRTKAKGQQPGSRRVDNWGFPRRGKKFGVSVDQFNKMVHPRPTIIGITSNESPESRLLLLNRRKNKTPDRRAGVEQRVGQVGVLGWRIGAPRHGGIARRVLITKKDFDLLKSPKPRGTPISEWTMEFNNRRHRITDRRRSKTPRATKQK